MSKEQNNQKDDKALRIGGVIKRYMYLIPLFGMSFTKEKEWNSTDYNLFFLYQWVMSFISPIVVMFFLRWANVL